MNRDYFDTECELEGNILLEQEVSSDAIEQFQKWLEQAVRADEKAATSFVLSTSTFEGKCSSRVVKLRRIDDKGLYFLTFYESRKCRQMLQNPHVSGVFYWPELGRQVRFEGTIVKLEDEENNKLFARCSPAQQLAAWSFPQSQVVSSRKYLETLMEDFREDFSTTKKITRPSNYGAYRIIPQMFEFWQGHANYLNDRLQYTLFNGVWKIERLAP
ncbi:MAG: pyridoxine/pyridoxamine 5'-phosphate oxidase [Bacteroides sp.]